MEDSYHSARPVAGRLVALDFRPVRPLTMLGPAWAALCGALAAGALVWSSQALLNVILLLLLCDALLGAWRARWLEADWRHTLPHNLARAQVWLALPDDPAASLFARLNRWVSRRIRFSRTVLWPLMDSEMIGMLMAGLLAVCVAVVLGTNVALLTGAALLLALIEGQVRTRLQVVLRASFEITLPWLIAESAFGYFSWLSLVFAALFTLVYLALLDLSSTRKERRLLVSNLTQLVVVALLIAMHVPAAAGIAALGLLAQVLWQTRFRLDRDGRTYAQHIQSYVLVAMLVTGLALWL